MNQSFNAKQMPTSNVNNQMTMSNQMPIQNTLDSEYKDLNDVDTYDNSENTTEVDTQELYKDDLMNDEVKQSIAALKKTMNDNLLNSSQQEQDNLNINSDYLDNNSNEEDNTQLEDVNQQSNFGLSAINSTTDLDVAPTQLKDANNEDDDILSQPTKDDMQELQVEDHNNTTYKNDNVLSDENLVNDLEAINDDFEQEIREQKEKEEEEARKKAEMESGESKEEENMELKPIVENNTEKNDIADLNLDNIEEYLRKNAKNIKDNENNFKAKADNILNKHRLLKQNEDLEQDEYSVKDTNNTVEYDEDYSNKEDKNCNNKSTDNQQLTKNYKNIDDKYGDESYKNIKLNEELWEELDLPEDLKNKIKIRVKIEIKTFLRENLMPIIEKIIRRI